LPVMGIFSDWPVTFPKTDYRVICHVRLLFLGIFQGEQRMEFGFPERSPREKSPQEKSPQEKCPQEKCPQGKMPTRKNAHSEIMPTGIVV